MNNSQKIVEALRTKLESQEYVHALWLEGSISQGLSDEYSDVDVWISVDDERVFNIFSEIEEALNNLGKVDFKYVVKSKGELGQNVYHIEGMSEFLTIDVNTQSIKRKVYLVEDIDQAKIIFDKRNVVKFKKRKLHSEDIEAQREKLNGFYLQMRSNVLKNVLRNKPLEALHYYHTILLYAVKFLRIKDNLSDKAEYGLKHVYKDLPKDVVDRLEYFYPIQFDDIKDKLEELRIWINSL